MAVPGPFIWWLGRGVEAFRLAPLIAAGINRGTGSFAREAWMARLEAYLVWDTVISACLLGMAMANIRNLWFSDLAFFPTFLLASWALCGLRPRGGLWRMLAPAGILILAAAAWEGFRYGLSSKWVLAMGLVSATLLLASLWELGRLLLQDDETPLHHRPQFWFLSVWALHHGMMLIFYPLSKFFLRTLSREWILYPWLVTYLLDAVFNLILAKTFLCPKHRSS